MHCSQSSLPRHQLGCNLPSLNRSPRSTDDYNDPNDSNQIILIMSAFVMYTVVVILCTLMVSKGLKRCVRTNNQDVWPFFFVIWLCRCIIGWCWWDMNECTDITNVQRLRTKILVLNLWNFETSKNWWHWTKKRSVLMVIVMNRLKEYLRTDIQNLFAWKYLIVQLCMFYFRTCYEEYCWSTNDYFLLDECFISGYWIIVF